MRTTCTLLASVVLLASAPVVVGCVPQGKYDEALKSANDAKAALADSQKKLDAQAAQLSQCQGDLAACTGKPLPPDHSAELTAQLEELRKQKAAAEARAALFNEFVSKFRKMIDAGRVTIHVRRGRIVLSLHNDVLFDEGRPTSSPPARTRSRRSRKRCARCRGAAS